LAKRPLGRRQAGQRSQTHPTIGIRIVEVMPDTIDRGGRVAWRRTADKREVRVVVVLADRAFDEPTEGNSVVLVVCEPERRCYPTRVERGCCLEAGGMQIGLEGL